MWNIVEDAWYQLQIKCGLTVDTGKKDADHGPSLRLPCFGTQPPPLR
jgi:hypothetical protein